MRKREPFSIFLMLAALVVIISTLLISLFPSRIHTDYYDIQLDAYSRMHRCMEATARYKRELGIAQNPQDICKTGMLGEEFNGITTTLGSLEAKRTSADPNMAALVVRMLHKAGLHEGNVVCAGFSGSFPSLNLAVLNACDAMNIKVVFISSVGASTFGANNPDLTFPELAHRLYVDGLIKSDSALITAGGDDDIGSNIDPVLLSEIQSRLTSQGLMWMHEPDFSKNIAARMALYDAESPNCFIAVGGNLTSLGTALSSQQLGHGVLFPTVSIPFIENRSGLIARYLARGLPVIHLLNIKQIVADYAMPFDPLSIAPPGTSAVFFTTSYSRTAIAAALASSITLLAIHCRKLHNKKSKNRQASIQAFLGEDI